MLLQLSNIRFEIKIYFQLGMDFIHASLCGLSLPSCPPPTRPFHLIATPPLDEVSRLFPLEEKIKSTITAPRNSPFFLIPLKKFPKIRGADTVTPPENLIHWCEDGGY